MKKCYFPVSLFSVNTNMDSDKRMITSAATRVTIYKLETMLERCLRKEEMQENNVFIKRVYLSINLRF